MALILFVLFLAVPIAELYVIVQAADAIGIPETILALIAISVAGAVLVRWQGAGVLARMGQSLGRGEVPAKEMVDGVLIVFAGALMLTPGFLTDAVGLALLLPPVRVGLRALLIRRFRDRVQVGAYRGGRFGFSRWGGTVYDVRSDENPGRTRPPDDPPSLGG